MDHPDNADSAENSQATEDSAARPRELIALCAAKSAGLDGAHAQRYARSVRNSLLLRPRVQATGTVLPLEKGIRLEFLRQAAPGLLLLVVCTITAISEPHFWIQSLFIAVIGLAFGLALGFAQVWSWREKLNTAWSTMLPGAGARIWVDSKCLSVGETSVPWDDVHLEAVELRYLWRPRIDPKYSIDQLRLAMSKGPLVLDMRLIENGQEVIDTICDNLV